MAVYQPEKAQTLNITKVTDIFRVRTPSLAAVRRDHGEQFAIDYLMLWVIELNEVLNVGKKMNEQQIKMTARLVMQENPLLTVADIKLVFDRGISGYYGADYNRLDSTVICGWFRKHWDERLEAAEQDSIMKSQETKGKHPTEKRTGEIQKNREAFIKYKTGRLK